MPKPPALYTTASTLPIQKGLLRKNALATRGRSPREQVSSVWGFTMIEVLVVIATMILIFMVGFANFRGSQKKQELSNAVLSVKTDLRFAQELALAGKKPSGCTQLNGYVLDSTGADRYRIVANCDNNVIITIAEYPEKNIKNRFPTVSLPAFTDVFFNVLGRGVKTSTNIVINLSNVSGAQPIVVTKGGEIN